MAENQIFTGSQMLQHPSEHFMPEQLCNARMAWSETNDENVRYAEPESGDFDSLMTNEAETGPVLKGLAFSVRRQLAILLDRVPSSKLEKNWEDLAYELGLQRHEVLMLRSSYQTTSEPSKKFFENLERSDPSKTVGELIVALEEIKRYDVVEFLKDAKEESTLTNLPFQVREDIALNLSTALEDFRSDWRDIACTFGYSSDEIALLESCPSRPKLYSPTLALLRLLEAKSPRLLLSKIIEKLEKLGREDAAEIVMDVKLKQK